jgi:hypothetical protein
MKVSFNLASKGKDRMMKQIYNHNINLPTFINVLIFYTHLVQQKTRTANFQLPHFGQWPNYQSSFKMLIQYVQHMPEKAELRTYEKK